MLRRRTIPACGAGLLLATALLAGADRKPTAKAQALSAKPVAPLLTVSPTAVSIFSQNPDSAAPGNQVSMITYQLRSAAKAGWTLSVGADSAQMQNCGSIPLSAVTVSCVAVGKAGACAAPFQLSTVPQTLAAGSGQNLTGTVTVSFGFSDRWRYPAQSLACILSLTYTLDVP